MQITAQTLVQEARAIIRRAEIQHRDLSEFESGRVDTLYELADRFGGSSPSAPLALVPPPKAA